MFPKPFNRCWYSLFNYCAVDLQLLLFCMQPLIASSFTFFELEEAVESLRFFPSAVSCLHHLSVAVQHFNRTAYGFRAWRGLIIWPSCVDTPTFTTDWRKDVHWHGTGGNLWLRGHIYICCAGASCMMPRVQGCARGQRAAFSRDGVAGGGGGILGRIFFVAQRTDHGFLEQCSWWESLQGK